MDAVSLKCFGVGDGFPSAERGHSSFLYRLGGSSILLDCGDGTSSRYEASGLDYDLVDHLFLSHLHADHIGGLLMFMQALWLKRQKKKLTVSLAADGIAPLRQMMHAAYLFEEMFGFELKFAPLAAKKPVTVDPVRLTPFPTTHLDGIRRNYQARYPQSFEVFSFLIESGPWRIAHSADLGAPEDLAPLLEKPVDLLVCEAAHFKAEALFDFLADRTIKKIIFIHLPEHHWQHQAALLKLAGQKLPGLPCVIAQPGQEFIL